MKGWRIPNESHSYGSVAEFKPFETFPGFVHLWISRHSKSGCWWHGVGTLTRVPPSWKSLLRVPLLWISLLRETLLLWISLLGKPLLLRVSTMGRVWITSLSYVKIYHSGAEFSEITSHDCIVLWECNIIILPNAPYAFCWLLYAIALFISGLANRFIQSQSLPSTSRWERICNQFNDTDYGYVLQVNNLLATTK